MEDVNDTFPYVGWFQNAEGGICSAVLISPLWVATANHCITGIGDQGVNCMGDWIATGGVPSLENADITVHFNRLRQVALPERQGVHTFASSGPVIVRSHDPVDGCTDEDAQQDFALIPLDRRVPTGIIAPLHPALVGNAPCRVAVPDQDDFEGILVGFGPLGTGFFGGAISPGDLPGYRSWRTSADWDFESDPPEGLYTNTWKITSTYTGPLPGDSGGPLVVDLAAQGGSSFGGHLLCGLSSQYYPSLSGGGVGASITSLDFGTNREILEDAIVAENLPEYWFTGGRYFLGECQSQKGCASYQVDVDTDEDGWPNCCDNCPDIRNPGLADSDNDQIGNACDLCPGVVTKNQTLNKNLEAEVAHFFGQDAVDPPASASIGGILGKIRPDACDPTPVPMAVRGEGSLLVDPSTGTTSNDTLPPGTPADVDCADPAGFFKCTAYTRNRVSLAAFNATTAIGKPGSLAVRHCMCTGPNRHTRAGRVQSCRTLQTRCYAARPFPPEPGFTRWTRLEARLENETWAQAEQRFDAGQDLIVNAVFANSEKANDGTLFYNFTKLPYATGVPMGKAKVEGVLGAWVTEFEDFEDVAGQAELASTYLEGDTSIQIHKAMSDFYKDLVFGFQHQIIAAELPWPCPLSITCPPFEQSDILVIKADPVLGNPPTGVTPGDEEWYPATDDPAVHPSLLPVIDALASGAQSLVRASEPPVRLVDRKTNLRAVTLDADGSLVTLLDVSSSGELVSSALCPDCPPIPRSEIVLNAEQSRLFTFGDGQPRVVQAQIVRSGAIPTVERTDFPLKPKKAPGIVHAAMWRFDDASIYALDRQGPVHRLRRWRYGASEFEQLGAWPTALKVFDKFHLSGGPEGDIVLVGTRLASDASVVIRLSVKDNGRLELRGGKNLAARVLAPPVVGANGVQLLLSEKGRMARYQIVDFSEIKPGKWIAQ